MGADGWKTTFPQSPWPSDLPGFAPFALYITGPIINYSDRVAPTTGSVTEQTLNWGGPVDARVLFGGTIGDNVGVVGALEGFSAGSTTVNMRAVWSFAPGVNLSFGNSGFSAWGGVSSPISVFTSVFPAIGVGTEFNYAVGKDGGLNVIAGLSDITNAPNTSTTSYSLSGAEPSESIKATTTKNLTNANKLNDIRYLRVKYKFFGAGLLSGANGTYGNQNVGLDNCFAIGVSVLGARPNMLSYGGSKETMVYGADIAGNYGDYTCGVACSKDKDLKLTNYAVDAGYYLYPWLLTRVRYANLGVTGVALNNPTVTPSVTAWLRANVFLAASYKIFTKNIVPGSTTGSNNPNTFTMTSGFAF